MNIKIQKVNNYRAQIPYYYIGICRSFICYKHTRTIHSGNLYQIFAYVKNEAFQLKSKQINVAGMLLYAKTDEQLVPDNTFQMSGNTISVKTLDLNQDFIHIAKQLDDIVYNYFKI